MVADSDAHEVPGGPGQVNTRRAVHFESLDDDELGPDGEVQALHDKSFLLAFGEYMPLGETFPSLYALSPETSRFQSGTRTEPVVSGKARIGMLICYEDLIPRYAARVAAHEAPVPRRVLVR